MAPTSEGEALGDWLPHGLGFRVLFLTIKDPKIGLRYPKPLQLILLEPLSPQAVEQQTRHFFEEVENRTLESIGTSMHKVLQLHALHLGEDLVSGLCKKSIRL